MCWMIMYVFHFEEHDESPCKDEANPSSGFQQTEITDRDLLYEVNTIPLLESISRISNELPLNFIIVFS